MIKKNRGVNLVKEILIMTIATAIIAAGVVFFLVPSNAAVSSISGLSIVLTHFIPLPVSAITMLLNVILLIIGFLTLGKEFGMKTVYTSILLPIMMWIYELLFPNFQSLTGEATLDVICYIFIVSIGLTLLFNMNASSGGLDIIAKIMNKYLRMDIGRAMSIAGMAIALSSILAYDTKTVILSVLGTYINGLVLDSFIFDHSLKRRVCIISPKEEIIRKFIVEELKSGATIYEAKGAYRMEMHSEIVTIVDKPEYQKLMKFIQLVDPDAFITVYKVSNIQYRSKSLEERIFDISDNRENKRD